MIIDGFQRECIEQAQLNRIDMVKDTVTGTATAPTKIVAQINFDNAKLKEIVDEAVKRLKEEMKWEVD